MVPSDGVWTVGARVVTGPAGSGKTSVLLQRYLDLINAGERGILFLVHSRRAARALADRVLGEVGHATDQVRVTTWHAFALSLLRRHHRALGYTEEPGLLTGPEQFTLVRSLLKAPEERDRWDARYVHLAGFAEELREFVLRAQDALALPEQIEERARLARAPHLEEAARFFRRYLDQLDAENVVDHANVIALAVALMSDADVARQVRDETRHLLVDDYQDVTPAQEVLLRALFVEGGSAVVTANPDARVFGFRGGSAHAAQGFLEGFGPGATEEVLGEVKRPLPDTRAWLFDHLTQEAEAIAREARRLHLRDGVPYGEIAVIVRRYGSAARAIRRAFEAQDVPYVVVGENRPLVTEPALVPMLEVARAALRREDLEDHLPRLLASPIVGLDPYDVRALRREARLRGTELAGMLAAPSGDLPKRILDALGSLRALLDEIVVCDQQAKRPDDVFWFLWDRLGCFREMVARADDAELDAVAAFARAIERFSDRRPGLGFADYLDALEGVEFGPEPWHMPAERRPDAVRIMSAHQAVGSEFEAVFVAGCTEGEFPDPRDKRAMIDIRDLLAPATPVQRERERLAEEKRLFGVAISRARGRLVVSCARESSQREALTPTPFLHLVADEWGQPPASTEPLSRAEAEATLRRIARDRSQPEAERRKVVDDLARLPGLDVERWWFEREWTDTGRPLLGEEFLTSYSRLNNFENCGLQYLYQVELGLDPEQTHAMMVGSWVHDIVDRCAKRELEPTMEALLAELDRVWWPGIFPSRAIEHRYRIQCEEMLERWLHADATVEPLATEVEFRFPLEGATVRGFIDRITRCGTKSVRLTDYKTGTNDKSEAEVREDLQLATYYLATRRDPNLARFGQPMVLELAFLARRDGRLGYKKPSFDPRRVQGFEEKTAERLQVLIDGVRNEEFAPRPDADCQWCKFKTLCPVWPEGDEVPL